MAEAFCRTLEQRSAITADEAADIVTAASRFIDECERSDEADQMMASLALHAISRLAKQPATFGIPAAVEAIGPEAVSRLQWMFGQSDTIQNPVNLKERREIAQINSYLMQRVH